MVRVLGVHGLARIPSKGYFLLIFSRSSYRFFFFCQVFSELVRNKLWYLGLFWQAPASSQRMEVWKIKALSLECGPWSALLCLTSDFNVGPKHTLSSFASQYLVYLWTMCCTLMSFQIKIWVTSLQYEYILYASCSPWPSFNLHLFSWNSTTVRFCDFCQKLLNYVSPYVPTGKFSRQQPFFQYNQTKNSIYSSPQVILLYS